MPEFVSLTISDYRGLGIGVTMSFSRGSETVLDLDPGSDVRFRAACSAKSNSLLAKDMTSGRLVDG